MKKIYNSNSKIMMKISINNPQIISKQIQTNNYPHKMKKNKDKMKIVTIMIIRKMVSNNYELTDD